MRTHLPILLLATALSLGIAPSAAANEKSINQRFDAALRLHDKGRCEEALPIFQEVVKSTQSPNARLYVALCLRMLDLLPAAYEEMSTTLRDASARADSEPKYAQTRDTAAALLVQIERQVGRLIIAVANPPPGVTVSLDGAVLPPGRVGSTIAVTPGQRTVTVSAPDRASVTREISVDAGETKTVAVALESAEEPATEAGTETGTTILLDGEAKRSGGGVRVAGYVVTGLGVAGMALFGVTGLMAQSKFKTLEEECGGMRCTDLKYADTVDSGKTLDVLATVGLIAGASGLAIGTTMIVFGGPSSEDEATSARTRGSKPKPHQASPLGTAGISVSPAGASFRYAMTF